jgi:hypothetical protein
MPASPPVARFSGSYRESTPNGTIDRFKDSLDKTFDRSTNTLDKTIDKAAPTPSKPVDDLIHLLTHQMADGSFDASGAVDQAVRGAGIDRAGLQAAMEKLLHDAHVPSAAREKIRQTLVVMLVLTLAFAGRKGTWDRAYKKAQRFVTAQGQLKPGVAQAWVEELAATFGKSASTSPVGRDGQAYVE